MMKRLGECLVEAGIINPTQLEEALRLQAEKQGFLGLILLEKGWITDSQLCQAVSQAFDVDCINIENILISEDVIALVSNSLAVTCHVLPLFTHHNTMYLAMENPSDTGVIQLVEYETGMQVKPLMAPPCHLREMITKYYQIDDSMENVPPSALKQIPSDIGKKIIREIGFGQRKRLGNILIESGLINQTQLETALEIQRERKGFLGEVIVDMGWVTEQQLCQVLSDMLHVESVDFNNIRIHPDVTKLVEDSLAASCNIFPLFVEQNTLYLAMENPLDTGVLLYLRYTTGMKIEPLVAAPSQIRAIIQQYYPLSLPG